MFCTMQDLGISGGIDLAFKSRWRVESILRATDFNIRLRRTTNAIGKAHPWILQSQESRFENVHRLSKVNALMQILLRILLRKQTS